MLALLPAFQVSFDAMTTADGDPDMEEIERFGADSSLAKTMMDELLCVLSMRAQSRHSIHCEALQQLRSTYWNRVFLYRELLNIEIVVDIESANGDAIT